MINPERLIGGLLSGALDGSFQGKKRRSKRSGLGGMFGANKAAVGMGLLGLAFAAMDHFQSNQGGTGSGPFGSASPGQPSNPGSAPPPPPSGSSAPPPPPGSIPPPTPEEQASERENEALLILRAMVAAANADYSIDSGEREGILQKAKEAGLSPEELELVSEELDHPKGMTDIVLAVRNPQQAEEVYVASLLAIEVDTESEKGYLRSLANRLDLDEATTKKWHDQLGVEGI